ncbi:MAG: glycine oxidase ThiO [Angustibacter sp.]
MDVVVVGAGVIGLSCAWRLAEQGAMVRVVDDTGPAASHVAAGMLAPVTEAAFGEEPLLRLAQAAVAGYPAYVEQLGGADVVALRREGTLSVGLTADDRAELVRLTAFRDGLGLRTEQLTVRQARELEPFLATSVGGAQLAVDDLSVDNRAVHAALRERAVAAGATVRSGAPARLLVEAGRAVGVATDADELRADVVVLAAGARCAVVEGVPAHAVPPVVPVKGHVLRLRPQPGRQGPPALTRTVRALVHGREVYLVPRADGELVVGATVEHQGFDDTVVVAAVRGLLRDAHEVLPVVDELALAEISTGLRPGSPDNAPAVGWSALPGLFVATGHYRNGILLSGVTGKEVARQVAGHPPSDLWQPFAPHRFDLQEARS